MPELPEVETTVRQLRKKVRGRAFVDVWSDSKKIIKKPGSFADFRKQLIGRKINDVERRGKNIIFRLSGGKTLLVHQKLTGHLLVGRWARKRNGWQAFTDSLSEKVNGYIHLLFVFDGGLMMALSDLRKFAKVELWDAKKFENSAELKNLGSEPLSKEFTPESLEKALGGRTGKIKQVLIDQGVIAGIGNIYSDEILWAAKIHPLRRACTLSGKEIREIYRAARRILAQAVRLRGASISDFRDVCGREGGFARIRKVYRRTGEKCPRCGFIIKRQKVGGRSAHFCPKCQKLRC